MLELVKRATKQQDQSCRIIDGCLDADNEIASLSLTLKPETIFCHRRKSHS